MNLELIYNSAACNATVKALDWGKNDLICYASCNSVIIYNPKVNFQIFILYLWNMLFFAIVSKTDDFSHRCEKS